MSAIQDEMDRRRQADLLVDAARMPNAAIIMDPHDNVPSHVEVQYDEWMAFREAWKRAGGRP